MKKITLIPFLILFVTQVFAQEKFIQLTKNETGKVKLFKENKRVKIKTLDGKKIIGRFLIIDESTILIKGNKIKLKDIERIKSRSIVAGVAGTIITVYGIAGIALTPIFVIFGGTQTAILFATISSIGASSGIFINEFVPTHQKSKWTYKIIEK